jgi:acetyl esterase
MRKSLIEVLRYRILGTSRSEPPERAANKTVLLRKRRTMAKSKPAVDPFVERMSQRLAELQDAPEPKDPAGRRAHAAAQDRVSSAALGIEAIPVATEEHTLPVPGHPDARLRVYWPSENPTAPIPEGERGGLPVLVYFFGGGFTIAGIDWIGWDAGFRRRAHEAGIIVIAGEYSLAPETRYPAQPEQCWTIFEWAAEHARSLGGDPARLAIGGASSGGNLAAAVTLMNRDRSRRPIRLQLLEAPALDLTRRHLETRGITAVPGAILRGLAGQLVRQYLGPNRATRREPYASPLLAPDHRGLPPAAIYTAEMDPLRGDGEAYARALGKAGVPATCVRYIGQTHTSAGLTGHVPSADHLHRDIIATLRTLHDDAISYDGAGPEAQRRLSSGG